MTHENIYYLLPLVYTCEYVYIYPRVSGIHSGFGIRGFGFGDGFPPESVSGSGSGFDFGFRFWVHGDSTRSEPDPLPALTTSRVIENNPCQKYTRPQGNITMAPVCFQKKRCGNCMYQGKSKRSASFALNKYACDSILQWKVICGYGVWICRRLW